MGDRQVDEAGRQGLEFLAIGDRSGECRGVFWRNALADIVTLAPNLMLKVGARFDPGRLPPVFGFETAQIHGLERSHLFKNAGSLSVEC